MEKLTYPCAPSVRETSAPNDIVQTVPSHVVEGFMKIQLQDNGGGVMFVIAVE
jgi:hypothetical protein